MLKIHALSDKLPKHATLTFVAGRSVSVVSGKQIPEWCNPKPSLLVLYRYLVSIEGILFSTLVYDTLNSMFKKKMSFTPESIYLQHINEQTHGMHTFIPAPHFTFFYLQGLFLASCVHVRPQHPLLLGGRLVYGAQTDLKTEVHIGVNRDKQLYI
jgi:hypothetical protein